MASKKQKMVVFKLLAHTTQKVKDKGDVEMTWGNSILPATYLTRNAEMIASKKVISVGQATHPKSGEKIPVPINGIQFLNGYLNLLEGRDQHIIDALRESVNNIDAKFRFPSDNAIYYELDPSKEKFKNVDANELIAEAYMLIAQAEVEELLEYAKALNVGETIELSAMLTKANTKEKKVSLKQSDEYSLLVKEMKHVAISDASKFIDGFSSVIRPFLALINEAMTRNVIGYNQPERSFYWRKGSATHTFIKVPMGRLDHLQWLAEWCREPENGATYTEILQLTRGANATAKL